MNWRILLASVVLAASLSGSLLLHRHTASVVGGRCTPSGFGTLGIPCPGDGSAFECNASAPCPNALPYTVSAKPSWDDPVAIIVLVLGVGPAGSIVLVRRRS